MKFKLQDVFHITHEQKAPDLGDGLLAAGTNAAAPPTPTPTALSIDPAAFAQAEPVAESTPSAPPVDPTESKVLKFIRICHVTAGLTCREISSGCDLSIADVRHALDSLVTQGIVKHSDEAAPNIWRYSLTTSPVPESPAAPVDRRSAEQIWSDAAAARARAEWAAAHPQPTVTRYEPSEEAIDRELAQRKSVVPLSEAERRDLDVATRNRRSINPQSYIVR